MGVGQRKFPTHQMLIYDHDALLPPALLLRAVFVIKQVCWCGGDRGAGACHGVEGGGGRFLSGGGGGGGWDVRIPSVCALWVSSDLLRDYVTPIET